MMPGRSDSHPLLLELVNIHSRLFPWYDVMTGKTSVGCLFGSVIGGRLSDHMLRRVKVKNGGESQPEVSVSFQPSPFLR
jgi:hypothetical protein